MVPLGVQRPTCQTCATQPGPCPLTMRSSSRTSCANWRKGGVSQLISYSSKSSTRFLEAHGRRSSNTPRLASAARGTRSTNQGPLFLGLIQRFRLSAHRNPVASASVATTLAGCAAKLLRFLR